MSTPDEQFEEEILDAHQTKVEKVRSFVRRYQTPIACGATAGFAFMVGRKVGMSKTEMLERTLASTENALDDTAAALGDALNFIDARKLTEKFAEYALEQTT